MNFEFENRWYSHYEILKLFQIREKTWKNWLYDNKTGKKKILKPWEYTNYQEQNTGSLILSNSKNGLTTL